jgi:2-polyprenyl-6-methoxyphenol hydroxylase-like FAD-dependent oxidoreductase
MSHAYDAIIVGARCAGAPTAMLLARKGYRVLLVDRATFPSDTLSTHIVQPRGVAALARWGLLERLAATGCPPIRRFSYDFGALEITGSPGTPEAPLAYCPRRTVLDQLLVDAAAQAGAEVREGFTVEEILFEEGRVVGVRGRAGGESSRERAAVVVGADGWHSLTARSVRASSYHERPPLSAAYYAYWSGLPVENRAEIHIRPHRGFGAAPTHDGLTMTIGGWPYGEFEARRRDVEASFLELLTMVPEFAERVRGARRVSRIFGAAIPNYFRQPYGPGWALVGDAGYLKDSITAQGISDAFSDAEHCSQALHEVFSGARSFDDAMRAYQHARDERALPMFEMTCQLATLEPPPPEMLRVLESIRGDQRAMDRFVQMNSGTISPADFFSTIAGAGAPSGGPEGQSPGRLGVPIAAPPPEP